MIERLRADFGRPGRTFQRIDLVSDDLPLVDLVMVRDLFLHLPLGLVRQALSNVRRSGSTWLLTSN